MDKSKRAMGIAMAVAAAGMLTTATPSFAASDKAATPNIHFYGVNRCNGHNDCKTAKNACKGHESFKGQGFVAVSEKACVHLGVKVGD